MVKVALLLSLLMSFAVMLHWQLTSVVQLPEPLVPALHVPIIVAFITGNPLSSLTVIMTVAFHSPPLEVLVLVSKSPMCIVGMIPTLACWLSVFIESSLSVAVKTMV